MAGWRDGGGGPSRELAGKGGVALEKRRWGVRLGVGTWGRDARRRRGERVRVATGRADVDGVGCVRARQAI